MPIDDKTKQYFKPLIATILPTSHPLARHFRTLRLDEHQSFNLEEKQKPKHRKAHSDVSPLAASRSADDVRDDEDDYILGNDEYILGQDIPTPL